jgi:L-ribulose-5-phosphate 3-epimerase UlaE
MSLNDEQIRNWLQKTKLISIELKNRLLKLKVYSNEIRSFLLKIYNEYGNMEQTLNAWLSEKETLLLINYISNIEFKSKQKDLEDIEKLNNQLKQI